jgi:uncharacterized Zn ribbon protein
MMGKKCIICEDEAAYRIKDSTEFYCLECADEHFSDITMLEKVEQQAQKLKEMIEERITKDVQND